MVIDSWTVWTRFDFYDFFNRRAPDGAIAGEWVNYESSTKIIEYLLQC